MGRRARPQPIANLHLVRGDLLVRSGEIEAGRRELAAEIEEHPDNLDAYTRLVFLHTAEGRVEEATALLRRMVDTSPSPAAYAAAIKTLRLLGDERQAEGLLVFAAQRFPEAEILRELDSAE
jgi:tetratricopeptide (TPR) repeat protein